MSTKPWSSKEIETDKDQSRQSPVNLGDDAPSVGNGKASSEQHHDSSYPQPLRIRTQTPPIAGLSFGHSSPYTLNPYGHISQGSFLNTLQDNYRHSSIDSSSTWDNTGTATPINDRRQLTSITWGSNTNLLMEDMPPGTPTIPFHNVVEDEKDPGSPTTTDISPPPSTKSGSISNGRAPTPVPEPPPGPPAPTWSKPHEWLFIATVCSAQFLSLASLAQTISPLLIIGDSLNVQSPGQLAWFTAAYSMTLGTFIIPAGRIGDMYGHKKIFILGWLWLCCGSFFAGFGYSWGPVALSVARGFQGIGPALLVPNAMALIGRTFGMGDKRAMTFSIFGACGPSGFFFGALFSAIFATKVWWPWAFWSTGLISLCFTFLSYCVIPESMAVPVAPPGQSIPKFDFLGCATGVTGLLLINFALNQAPLVGWNTPYIYFLFVFGIFMTVAFFLVELRFASSPLLPMRGLQPQALLALACIAAGWASHGIWLYYLFLFSMRIRNQSALVATLELLPVVPLGVAFALSTNFLVKKIHVSKVMLIAMLLFLIGTLLLAFAPAGQTYWALTFLSVLVMPGGMNLSFPAGTILLSNAMPREHQGKAASLVSTVVNYSIASGLGIAGSIERHVNNTGGSQLDGYRAAWYLGIGFSTLGVFISLFFVWMSRTKA